MTKREKFLATIMVIVATVLVCGVLFHLFVMEPYNDVQAQMLVAQELQITKQGELDQEKRQIVPVSAPEALAMVDQLQRQLSRGELEALRERAGVNARSL